MGIDDLVQDCGISITNAIVSIENVLSNDEKVRFMFKSVGYCRIFNRLSNFLNSFIRNTS